MQTLIRLAAIGAEIPTKTTRGVAGGVDAGIEAIEALPGDIAQISLFQHLNAVLPAADLVFGATMLLLIVLFHATGVRFVTSHVVRRSQVILQDPTTWRADLLMSGAVFMLLALHL